MQTIVFIKKSFPLSIFDTRYLYIDTLRQKIVQIAEISSINRMYM